MKEGTIREAPWGKGHRQIWHACIVCGKERWVQLEQETPRSVRCKGCGLSSTRGKQISEKHRRQIGDANRGARNHLWKGGRFYRLGYVLVRVYPNDFFYPMVSKQRYVLEHRLIMAKHLGRNLHSWELVHHKNHVRDDNRIENLQLVGSDKHKQITIMENRIRRLEKRVTVLEAENILLRESRAVY